MKWLVKTPENLVSFIQKGVTVPCSGKALRRVLESNLCRVNGKIERFGSTRLQKGDRVELAPDWQDLLVSKELVFPTLYEDDQCLIVDKPAGWVCKDRKGALLVHRLDKETTGALLFAKGRGARDALMELFANRTVEKEYLALVDGLVREDEGIQDTLLSPKRSYQGQTIWGSGPKGQKAVTRWKVLARGNQASLIQCMPVTGRTHQIRVHASEMGHPILADRQYAPSFRCSYFAKRVLLHARRLKFKEIEAIAEVSEDFRLAVRALIPQAHAFL